METPHRGRGRPRRNPEPNPELVIEPVVDQAGAGPAGAGGAGGAGRDRDLDDRLIAAYERGRQAQIQDAAPVAHGGAPEDFRRLYDAFLRLNPPRYDGTGGYAAAEEWLAQINAKLKLCRAPEEDKVELVEQQLESDARFCWDGTRGSYDGEEARIPWEWFEQHFNRRFLSNIQRETLRRKFLELKQNGRPVAEYNSEFLALSRYATDIRNDVERYNRQYLDGLDGHISMIVDTPMATELQAMMDHAEQIEMHGKRRKEQVAERNVKQKEAQSGQMSRSRGGPSFARSARSSMAPRPPFRQTSMPSVRSGMPSQWCRSCNQAHDEVDCRRKANTCFVCGSAGHWARECPNALVRMRGAGSMAGSAGVGRGAPTWRGRGASHASGANASRASSSGSVGRVGGAGSAGRGDGRAAAHALNIAGTSSNAATALGDGQTNVMTGILSISDRDTYLSLIHI